VRLEGLGKVKKCNDLIGYLTRDLSTCSIPSQPLRYRVPPPPPIMYTFTRIHNLPIIDRNNMFLKR
jgi:hypothetical protein